MTIAPTVHSAYPSSIDDLLPRARALAATLGEIPSRNRLKRELRIGSPKADALRTALTAQPTPAPPILPAPMVDPPPTQPTPTASTSMLEGNRVDPGTNIIPSPTAEAATPVTDAPHRPVTWPVWLLALPAFVAIWSGWVGLGGLTGFGMVHPLPGIWDDFSINSAITLPIGVETYAAFALRAWLADRAPGRVRRFAKWSAIGSLLLGALGQVAYHLMDSAGMTSAPWWITTAVACLPVVVLGMGAALAHLMHDNH